MIIVEFEEVNVKIAEDQEEYQTVPAHWNGKEGSIVYCFKLTQGEIDEIVETRKVYFKQLTFGKPMQPVHPSVFKNEVL